MKSPASPLTGWLGAAPLRLDTQLPVQPPLPLHQGAHRIGPRARAQFDGVTNVHVPALHTATSSAWPVPMHADCTHWASQVGNTSLMWVARQPSQQSSNFLQSASDRHATSGASSLQPLPNKSAPPNTTEPNTTEPNTARPSNARPSNEEPSTGRARHPSCQRARHVCARCLLKRCSISCSLQNSPSGDDHGW